ncbi:hypothetical protein J1N35_000837, partial [Gossypium stocksii]
AGVQVGLETHQCVCREVETRDTHILSFMWGVYHHFGGSVVTGGVTGGLARTHQVRFRILFIEVESIWAGYERHSWCWGMIRLKYKEWNHSPNYKGIPTTLKDIQLLLGQRSEAHFQWTPYEDPTIRAVILDEFLQNPNI